MVGNGKLEDCGVWTARRRSCTELSTHSTYVCTYRHIPVEYIGSFQVRLTAIIRTVESRGRALILSRAFSGFRGPWLWGLLYT